MKFLIVGATGMAGNTVSNYLKSKGYSVDGIARRGNASAGIIECDVIDTDKLRKIVINGAYDCIVNCVGILNKSAEDNHDLAVFLNSYLPQFLSATTLNLKTKCIFLSTDCVFSGKRGGYVENDFPDEKSFYGRSKALGEVVDNKNLTIRTSIIGPDVNIEGIGLFNWFMRQSGKINGFVNAIWTGITTIELAKIVEQAALSNCVGLVNMVNNETISKYELVNLFNEIFRSNSIEVEQYLDYHSNKSLIRTNFDLDYQVSSYRAMIEEMKDWIDKNRESYSHYNF